MSLFTLLVQSIFNLNSHSMRGIVSILISQFIFLLLVVHSYGQRQQLPKSQAGVSIFVKNDKKEPQVNCMISLEGLKDHKILKVKTNDNGLAEAVLLRGQNYAVHLKGLLGYDTIVAEYNSSQIFNFYIQYDKNQPASIHYNPLACNNIQPSFEQVVIEVVAPQFIGDSIEIINYNTGVTTKMYIGSTCCQRMPIKKGDPFGVRWRGFIIEERITFPKNNGITSLEIRLYKGFSRTYNGALTKEQKEFAETVFAKESGKENDIYINKVNIIDTIFKRREWKNVLIVMDVTGSMYSYINDLQNWFWGYLKNDRKLQFAFFNDGDSLPDGQKVVGDIGGIYFSKSSMPHDVAQALTKCMLSGTGGDTPENDIEALIKASALAKPFEELILVADNFAPVKDLVLLTNVNKPVRIIVCGSEYSPIHPDYLYIAYKTNGSIHTLNEDLLDFSALKNKGEINIDGRIYKFENEKFILVK